MPSQGGTYAPIFTAAFKISEIWKQPKCLPVGEWIQQNVACIETDTYLIISLASEILKNVDLIQTAEERLPQTGVAGNREVGKKVQTSVTR